MCDDDIHQHSTPQLSRRALALSAGALAILKAAPVYAADEVVERDVTVTTPDGRADAALFYPARGKHPAVLIWTDVFGLRPAFRDMGRRLAAQGYVVLVPNPYYRAMRATTEADYAAPEVRQKYFPMMGALTPEGTTRDGVAFIAFLDAQPQTDLGKKAGVQGYCMGGPLTFRTASAVPNRVGAAATFHGAALVGDAPTSPHRLIPLIKAEMLVDIADNDDQRQPDAKDRLKASLRGGQTARQGAGVPGLRPWLVREGQRRLQRGGGRAGLGGTDRPLPAQARLTGLAQDPRSTGWGGCA